MAGLTQVRAPTHVDEAPISVDEARIFVDEGPVPVDEGPTPADAAHQLSRRDVLKAFGIGGAAVVVVGTGALSYRVLDSGALDPASGSAYEPWEHWHDPGPLGAVGAAVLAASPHNTQPWLFHITADAIDVHVDPSRNLGSIDPVRREQYVGLGCAVENLTLACLARGLGPTVALLPDGPGASRVARLTLTPGPSRTDRLYEAIGRRHSNRAAYEQGSLSPARLAGLVDGTDLPGVTVHWVSEAGPKTALGQLLVDAAAALTADPQQSQDTFAWWRGSKDAVQAHRDGATLDAQGLSPLMLSLAKLMPASSRSAGDAFWVEQTKTVHTATAAAYGVLVGADPDDRATQLRAGRLLERIHLTATDQGLALQPMNQITERMDRERALGAPATFGPRFAALLPGAARPLVMFRIGRPTQDGRPSPRQAAATVLR